MKKQVTVDVDDLEALLFSTGTIKAIEDAVLGRKGDPLVDQAKGRLHAAHDALAAQWRNAKRELPPEAGDITEEEKEILWHIDRMNQPHSRQKLIDTYRILNPITNNLDMQLRTMRSLRMKNLLEIGNVEQVLFWGSGDVERNNTGKICVRLTQHGKNAIDGIIIPATEALENL